MIFQSIHADVSAMAIGIMNITRNVELVLLGFDTRRARINAITICTGVVIRLNFRVTISEFMNMLSRKSDT